MGSYICDDCGTEHNTNDEARNCCKIENVLTPTPEDERGCGKQHFGGYGDLILCVGGQLCKECETNILATKIAKKVVELIKKEKLL